MRTQITAAVTAALLLAGCGGAARSGPPATSTRTVVISGYAYHPAKLTVPAGTRIIFVNRDHTSHTGTSSPSDFDTGTIHPGQTVSVRVLKTGTYTFYCQFHAFMRGEVTVTRAGHG